VCLAFYGSDGKKQTEVIPLIIAGIKKSIIFVPKTAKTTSKRPLPIFLFQGFRFQVTQ
jgi:hypothetical protein